MLGMKDGMYSLNDTIDLAGDWWDSQDQNTRIPGQLTFDQNKGIELRVNQAFSPPHGEVRVGDANPRYVCIHGVTVKGEAVTLIDAQQFGTSLNFGTGGIREPAKIYARILVMGAHIPPQFRYRSISFRIPGLQVWLAHQVIAGKMHFDANNMPVRQDYSLISRPAEEFNIPAITSIVSILYSWNQNIDAYSTIEVSVSSWFRIKPDTPMLVDWFLEQNDKLLTLVSLLAGQLMLADSIQAQIDDSSTRVSVLFASEETSKPKMKLPSDFFLSRDKISIPFSECCKKWFEVVPKFEKAATLTKSIMASEDLWLHMRFLSLLQALEGLHRSMGDGKYMKNIAYEAVVHELQNAIPDSVNPDHRSSLKSKIKYGNQYSLRKRLKNLEASLTDEIRKHLFGPTKSAPHTWIDTRNYYTHWDEELIGSVLDNQEMYFANIRLTHFLCTMFRILIGVPESDIEAAFLGSSSSAQQLIQINIIARRAADPTFVPQAIMKITRSDNNEDSDPSKSVVKDK